MPAADGPSREHIGPYRLVARVGAGGMGDVFKAFRVERPGYNLAHPSADGTR